MNTTLGTSKLRLGFSQTQRPTGNDIRGNSELPIAHFLQHPHCKTGPAVLKLSRGRPSRTTLRARLSNPSTDLLPVLRSWQLCLHTES